MNLLDENVPAAAFLQFLLQPDGQVSFICCLNSYSSAGWGFFCIKACRNGDSKYKLPYGSKKSVPSHTGHLGLGVHVGVRCMGGERFSYFISLRSHSTLFKVVITKICSQTAHPSPGTKRSWLRRVQHSWSARVRVVGANFAVCCLLRADEECVSSVLWGWYRFTFSGSITGTQSHNASVLPIKVLG